MSEPDRSGIVLVGMPGSGKSTVGRLVAQRLGVPHLDTDELAERRIGMPVPAYIERHGEAAFRVEEAEAVREACATPGAIISTGGGAALDPLNRWALWQHGTVAWLDLDPERLNERLRSDGVARPTLQPYSTERTSAVLASRSAVYRAADLRIEAGGTPDSLATEVMNGMRVTSARRLLDAEVPRHHPMGGPTARVVMGVELDEVPDGVVVLDRRLLDLLPGLVRQLGTRTMLPIRGGERAKRIGSLERILEWLARHRVERSMPSLAVGGGTIGDLAGTAAALYVRGIPLIQVPTTWLAQADSAIGGKVAVDLGDAKNAVGAFWPPVAVISDVATLRSLPIGQRRDGMAESVKSALIGDPAAVAAARGPRGGSPARR